MEREDLLEKIYQSAYKNEGKHGNCSQSLLAAINEHLGLVDDRLFKASHGLTGGIAVTTEGTCGALAAGIMLIGTKLGRSKENYYKATPGSFDPYKPSKRLLKRFTDEYGTCICNEVHKKIFGRRYDLWDEREFKDFEKADAHTTKCPEVVANTARWTIEILIEEFGEEIQKLNISNKLVKVKPGHTRKTLDCSDSLMMCESHTDRGAVVVKHSHHSEQIGYVVRGKLLMIVDGKSKIYEEGQSYFVPSQSEHSAESVEDSVFIDVFCPPMAEFK